VSNRLGLDTTACRRIAFFSPIKEKSFISAARRKRPADALVPLVPRTGAAHWRMVFAAAFGVGTIVRQSLYFLSQTPTGRI